MASAFAAQLLLSALLLAETDCYYLPGTFPQAWQKNEWLSADVNSLTSFETQLPFDYYSLPFCKPPGGPQPAGKNVNVGTFMTGQRLQTSLYNFTMMVDESAKEVCPDPGFYGPLSNHEAENLQEKIKQEYRVNLVLDNLPATTCDLEEDPDSIRTGFDLGFIGPGGDVYINNHIMFKILVHPVTAQFLTASEGFYAAELDMRRRRVLLQEGEGAQAGEEAPKTAGGAGREAKEEETEAKDLPAGDMESGGNVYYTVVGFEVRACSIKRDPGWLAHPIHCPGVGDDGQQTTNIEAQPVVEGAKIVYTYDVEFEVSDIKWVSRWDAYLRMPRGQVHWFSLLNSILVVFLLSGVVGLIMLRTIRRDLAKYEEMLLSDPESREKAGGEVDSGWKVLKSDVFRAPSKPFLLSMMVGMGLQIFVSSFVTLFFGALGFLSPAVRGALLSTLLGLYMMLSTVAGFSSVYLHSAIVRTTENWRFVALKTTGSVPLGLIGVLLLLNLVIKHTGSSGAIPFSALLPISLTWVLVCFPLGYFGGVVASRLPLLVFPTRTSPVPREVPNDRGQGSRLIIMLFGSGLLVFGNIFVELYFAMTSMWQGYFYYLLGFVLTVIFLIVIITIQVAVVTTYMQFCQEDYRWWWQSFHRGGAVAFYVALYAIGFLIWSLHILSGFTSVFLYLVYMSMLVMAIYLSLGSIGFVFSFWFTHMIFSTAKAD